MACCTIMVPFMDYECPEYSPLPLADKLLAVPATLIRRARAARLTPITLRTELRDGCPGSGSDLNFRSRTQLGHWQRSMAVVGQVTQA